MKFIMCLYCPQGLIVSVITVADFFTKCKWSCVSLLEFELFSVRLDIFTAHYKIKFPKNAELILKRLILMQQITVKAPMSLLENHRSVV